MSVLCSEITCKKGCTMSAELRCIMCYSCYYFNINITICFKINLVVLKQVIHLQYKIKHIKTNKTNLKKTIMLTIDRYREEMEKIRPNISTRDRREVTNSYGYNKGTVSQYINNDEKANSLDVYYDLLSFFKQRIAERNSILTTEQ